MNRMRLLREELKLSKAQVARDLEMAYTTYVNYENEAREPNSEVLILVANYFDVSVDYLIGRTENRKNNIEYIHSDDRQNQLYKNFQQLNETGQIKLLEYSEDLVNSGNYIIQTQKEKRA